MSDHSCEDPINDGECRPVELPDANSSELVIHDEVHCAIRDTLWVGAKITGRALWVQRGKVIDVTFDSLDSVANS